MRAPGSLFGRTVRHRIERIVEDLFPEGRHRPSHLDDTLRTAAEKARRRGLLLAPGAVPRPGPGARLMSRVRARVGLQFMRELEMLSEVEWKSIAEFARANLRAKKRRDIAKFKVKGFIAERMIPNLPQFAKLQQELGQKLKRMMKSYPAFADLDPQVRFVRDVQAIYPGQARWLDLTDGVFVAYALDADGKPTRVVVLAVIEAKSLRNYPDLLEEGLGWRRMLENDPRWKKRSSGGPERPRPVQGQLSRDFERFSELRVRIDGVEFDPDQVTISRHKELTRWVPVLPRDVHFTRDELAMLARQGFDVEDQWNLPIPDEQMNRIADAVLVEVDRP